MGCGGTLFRNCPWRGLNIHMNRLLLMDRQGAFPVQKRPPENYNLFLAASTCDFHNISPTRLGLASRTAQDDFGNAVGSDCKVFSSPLWYETGICNAITRQAPIIL